MQPINFFVHYEHHPQKFIVTRTLPGKNVGYRKELRSCRFRHFETITLS